MPDYAKRYEEFWKEIVENPDGTLNKDQVMRELSDYSAVMHEVAIAYDSVTGKFSKPNTAAHHVISAVDERIAKAARDDLDEAAELLSAAGMTEAAGIVRAYAET
jgi:hypothetical protein